FGAKNPRSWMMRFHSQTAGVTLTAQHPTNNVVRVAYQALAAVLGGTQSLHTNSMDETLSLPTEGAVQVALRTQQILAFESGVPNVMDPLGGSYYVEALTDQLEREAEALFEQINEQGGVVKGLEDGWFQKRIAEAAARQQWEIEQHRKLVVGVNEFVTENEHVDIPLLRIGDEANVEQQERQKTLKATRDNASVARSLNALREAARGTANVVPFILDCARAYCTLFEIRAALEDVFGAYREPVFF
ncbi:MAG: methylmalonyl-CoA mutase family protein, partial [Gemmatimonadota bacterium]|nr:methylmalonyl-CoA mutase family protein [Gemmatimonadota bacterium]